MLIASLQGPYSFPLTLRKFPRRMSSPKRYTVTAALPYANGPIHIGHLAGVYIPADIYARYLRNKKKDVLFICGSDEHGVAITMKARKEGKSPQQIVDKYHGLIKKSFEDFGIAFDHYSRTSAPIHRQTASDFFSALHEKGVFIQRTSEQYFDEEAQQFLADRYLSGSCPHCGFSGAYGDQCEKCGSTLSPEELIEPRSALSGTTPTRKATRHYYLPLDAYEDWLREWVLEGHRDWKTNVYGQVKGWIEAGLKARAVTRDLNWGVPVPLPDAANKVLYVWFEAPIGYLSATKEWAAKTGEDWRPYWQDEETSLIHFLAKDNIVFHCIIFPSMLKAHGGLILPSQVPANEFLNLENKKISTSRNWAVWLHEYLQDFKGQQDVLRYVLTANMPETKDNNFTWKDFQTKNNAELVGILGNFVHRVVVLTQKYYQGVAPTAKSGFAEGERLKRFPETIGRFIERFEFRNALKSLLELARMGNGFLQEQQPWKKSKTQPQEVKDIIYTALQIAAAIGYLSEPFLPHTAQKLKAMLNLRPLSWDEVATADLIPAGHQIREAQLLFERIEEAAMDVQRQKLTQHSAENATAPGEG